MAPFLSSRRRPPAREIEADADQTAETKEVGSAQESALAEPERDTQSPAAEEFTFEPWKAWGTVLSGFLISFCGLGYDYAFGYYQSWYQLHQFTDVSPTLISLTGSIALCLELSCGLVVGRLCELFGMRLSLAIGSVVYVVALISASFCNTIPELIATQGVIRGLGGSVLFLVATSIPVPYFKRNLSLAMGIVACGSGIGGICWSFLIKALIQKYDYKWALRISGLMCIPILGIALLFVTTPDNHSKAARRTPFMQTLKVFKDPTFILLYLSSGITVFGYVVPFFYLSPYIEVEADASATLVSTMQSILNVGLICGRLLLAALADTRFGRVNTVVSAMTLSGVWELTIWMTADGRLAPSFVFAYLYGFCAGGYIGLFPIVLPQLFDPALIASMTGIFFSSELIGQLVAGPIAGAILTQSNGNYLPVIGYGGATMLFGSLFAIAARFRAQPKLFASI